MHATYTTDMRSTEPTNAEKFAIFVHREWPTAKEADIQEGIEALNKRSRRIVEAFTSGEFSATEIGQQEEPPISMGKVSEVVTSAASEIALRNTVTPVELRKKEVDKAVPCAEDPELPFRTDDESILAIKALCAKCPVRRECLELAGKNKEKYGVWGGLTRNERLAIARREARDIRKARSATIRT